MVPFYLAPVANQRILAVEPRLVMDAVQVDATLAGMHLQRQGYYALRRRRKVEPLACTAPLCGAGGTAAVTGGAAGSAKDAEICNEIARTVNSARTGAPP